MNRDLILVGRRTIEKEAKALGELVHTLGDSFAESCEEIFSCQGTVLTTGIGKSGLVARKWAATFSSTGTKSYFLNAAEASHGDLGIVHPSDLLIALSFSGETDELGSILRHCRETAIPTIAVTGNPESSLASQAKHLLSVHLSEEACPLGLAPTSSTTVMMALGDALAVTLMQMRGFTEKDFARLHPGGSLGRKLWLRVEELMHRESLPIVGPEAPMSQVIIEMTSSRLGVAVVMEGKQIIGIVTDGDLRRALQSGKFLPDSKASVLMTKNPKSLSIEALAVEAREIMEKFSIQQLLITGQSGELVGILHLYDLLKAKVL